MSSRNQKAQALKKQEQAKQPFQVIENDNQNQAAYQQFQAQQQQQFAAQAAAQAAYNQAMQQFSPQQQNPFAQFNPFAQQQQNPFAQQQQNPFAQQQQNPFAQQQQFAARQEEQEEEQEEARNYVAHRNYAEYNNDDVNPDVEARRNRAQYVGNIITALYEIIAARKNANPEASYTAHLHQEGSAALARKMMSDAANATFTLLSSEESKYAVDDASNVIYDLLVMLEAKGYDVTDLCGMLEQKIEESEGDVGALVDGNFQDNPRYYQQNIENNEEESRQSKSSAQPRQASPKAKKAKAPKASAKARQAAPKAKAQKAAAQPRQAAPKAKAQKAAAQPRQAAPKAKAPKSNQ
jgi:phosphoribosyl-ATP pyrophosphohydrolase